MIEAIRSILELDTAGDPMSAQRWTLKTSDAIAQCLKENGIQVSGATVRRLLRALGYSLKSNRKCISAGNSPHRDTQFGIIQQLRQEFTVSEDPIISIDTKKKELIGLFKNPGRRWCREATKVKDHDFRSEAEGIATPYGIYDTQRNHGVLVVGQSADTPQFATNSIALWWQEHGQANYPGARRLLILADSGGSNAARSRAFKKFLLENIADRFGLEITIAHYPTGASKWNPIEHRMFSEISKNWAGTPLTSLPVMLQAARTTKTTTGLSIDAYWDQADYKKGIKVSDKEMKALNFVKSEELGQWNYVIKPQNAIVMKHEITEQESKKAA